MIADDSGEANLKLELERVDDEILLADGDATSHWRLFSRTHQLTSEARADQRPGDDREEVPIWWAAPVDRLDRPGKFWAFFPTATTSLVPGILNAPWKTDESRQILLSGRYNDELIKAASELIVEVLPQFSTDDDPARHLNALPRGYQETDSDQAKLLRNSLFASIRDRPVVPDQDGSLRRIRDISYPPQQLTADRAKAQLDRWAVYPARPSDWLHHKALIRNRLATIDRLFLDIDQQKWRSASVERAPRASIAEWLEALVQQPPNGEKVAASAAAIQVASLISQDISSDVDLGEIVLTAADSWRTPYPDLLFLPDELQAAERAMDLDHCVHPALASDSKTLMALQSLGLRPPSPKGRFRFIAELVLAPSALGPSADTPYESFWTLARFLDLPDALSIIREHKNWPRYLRCRVRSGKWRPLHVILLPGKIVPDDGSRDESVTVDMAFHRRDESLLRELGVTGTPEGGRELKWEPEYQRYLNFYKEQYRQRDDLPSRPRKDLLAFLSTEGVGPLTILSALSDEGRALLTHALLEQEATYEPNVMWHTGSNKNTYPKAPFESPIAFVIRKHGLIQAGNGIASFVDALGPQPENPQALHILLQHPNADKIKQTFKLSEPTPEFYGEGDPIPLTDIWPGLQEHLPTHRKAGRLIFCQGIRIAGTERVCVFYTNDVYFVGNVEDNERRALELVAESLGLSLAHHQVEAILHRRTSVEVDERRAAIRRRPTDAERLLAAVGEDALRTGLPQSLLDVLSVDGGAPTGIDLAEAAIATHHTDALRQYRWALDNLAPPSQWAGSRRAVDFVMSLGFPEEWAGERNRGRPPYLEVEGPLSLPPLHDYQEIVAANVRQMLRSKDSKGANTRGMLTMPTGSGKTRVAV